MTYLPPPSRSAKDRLASWKVAQAGPPAILFYGTEDPLEEGGRDFTRKLIAAGTRTEFYTAAGQPHGFFNRFPDSPWHALVLRQIDVFLTSLGYLEGNATVGFPPISEWHCTKNVCELQSPTLLPAPSRARNSDPYYPRSSRSSAAHILIRWRLL
jgi:hypothetical protein